MGLGDKGFGTKDNSSVTSWAPVGAKNKKHKQLQIHSAACKDERAYAMLTEMFNQVCKDLKAIVKLRVMFVTLFNVSIIVTKKQF